MSLTAVSELAAKFVLSVSRVNVKMWTKWLRGCSSGLSSRTVCIYDYGTVGAGMLAHSPNKACTGRREDFQTLIRWQRLTPKDSILCGDLELGKLTS